MTKEKIDPKYKIAFLSFLLGIVLLIIPSQIPSKVDVLPETGDREVSIKVTADKEHIQGDDPAYDSQTINYTIDIENLNLCQETLRNIVIVYDNSGSMTSVITNLREDVLRLIDNIDLSQDEVGIVAHNKEAVLYSPLTKSRENLERELKRISAKELTNLGAGIETATNELVSNRNGPNTTETIIIFSDGRPNLPLNGGKFDSSYADKYAVDKAEIAKDLGIRIIAVAYSPTSNYQLMKNIASPGSGNIYDASDNTDVNTQDIYSAILENYEGASLNTHVDIDINQFKDILDIEENNLSWDLGTLLCQETRKLSFPVYVNRKAKDLDTINLSAILTNDNGLNKRVGQDKKTIVHAPNIQVSKTDYHDEVSPGSALDYNISLENIGTGNAYNLYVQDQLPDKHFSVNEDTISNDGSFDSDNIIWDNNGENYILDGSFEPTDSTWGNSIKFNFIGYVDNEIQSGVYDIENSVIVRTNNGYTFESSDSTYIYHAPDLVISKVSDPSVYTHPDDTLEYKIEIENIGNISATNIEVIDSYDQRYLLPSVSNGIIQDGRITWAFELLRPGEKKEFTYTAKVINIPQEVEIVIGNEARITSDEEDIDSSNNISINEITATDKPLLEITVESNSLRYTKNEEITYTITIQNNSEKDAYNTDLSFMIPEELTYSDESSQLNGLSFSDPEYDDGLRWNIGYLPSKATTKLTFNVRPKENCPATNITSTIELNWDNNLYENIEPIAKTHTINISEDTDYQETIAQESDKDDSEEPKDSSIVELFEELEGENEGFVYLKVLLGLALALPLPLMLIFERRSKKQKALVRKKVRRKKVSK